MTDFHEFQHWFDQYIERFNSLDTKVQQNYDLKTLHTKKVCKNAAILAEKLAISTIDTFIIKTAALFHDIGRYVQYQKYKTFVDKHSADHAQLGLNVLAREKILNDLPKDVANKIIVAIKYHNKLEIPKWLKGDFDFFTRLLRDADKLDIFRVVIDYYEKQKQGHHNEAIVLGLPDDRSFSDDVIADIMAGEIVKSQDLKSINDFKLLQMAWVFDINFTESLRIITAQKFIPKIYRTLPPHEKITAAYKKIIDHMNRNCKNENKALLF